jgi:phosphoglycolate phosphatase-like HAD superfamily hydrolase
MKPDLLANVMVHSSGFAELIDHVQGSTGLPPKPDPEVLIRSMKALYASRAVLIGDRPEDVLCAKNAGILAIGVAQTSFSTHELEANGADFVYESLTDFALDLEELKRKICPQAE